MSDLSYPLRAAGLLAGLAFCPAALGALPLRGAVPALVLSATIFFISCAICGHLRQARRLEIHRGDRWLRRILAGPALRVTSAAALAFAVSVAALPPLLIGAALLALEEKLARPELHAEIIAEIERWRRETRALIDAPRT